LVTGCSTGIGLATARVLRARRWTVWPTARRAEDLARLMEEGFDPIALDVADPASVESAAAAVLERSGGRLGGLVNNAGVGIAGAVEDLSRDALRRQFEVNVVGLVDLTNRLIPAMRAQGAGRIVNIGSVLGRIVAPMVGAYCASKYALEALSDAWRIELWDTGIGVSIVEPGPIESAFRRNAAEAAARWIDADRSRFREQIIREIERKRRGESAHRRFMRPPEDVARVVVHALESSRPRRRYPVTLPAHFGVWAGRWLPTAWLDRLRLAGLRSDRPGRTG